MLHKVFNRMLRMCEPAWECLIRSLQFCCLFLLCSLLLLSKSQVWGEHQMTVAALQECAQLFLLFGAILPPCLEEMLGNGAGSPPGSSKR